MTARSSRRHRSTVIAAGAIAVVIAAAIGLGIAGGVAIYHSTEGADATDDRPEVVFPDTPTGLLAAVDDDGRLASLAIVVLRPNGAGGNVVTVPVSADASSGGGDERLPVAETAELSGIEAVEREVEIMLGLTIESFEAVDQARLQELLAPVGDIDVDLPVAVTDGDGRLVAEAGAQTMDPETAAAVLVARDPSVPAVDQFPAATAVWAAVAEAVGEGIDTATVDDSPATSAPERQGIAAPADGVDALLSQALAGGIGTRGLSSSPVPAARNERDVDVVMLDRIELAFVFGQIAPGKVAAPNPALTFRVESPFDDSDLDGSDLTNDDVAYRAISQLLFVRGNVQSVDTASGDVPEVTSIEVADDSLVDGVESTETFLGDIDIQVAEARIVGVDAVVRLGASYVEFLSEADEGD
jgi:hypothetical protein